MGHHNDLYDHYKIPDALEISLSDMIYPGLRSQGSMVKTPVEYITIHNQSMLVETKHGEALIPNGLLTYSDPVIFFIFKSLIYLPSKWYRRRITRTEFL